MNIELNNKIANDTVKGNLSEDNFIKLLEIDGYKCIPASRSENIYEHWDVCAIKVINGIKNFDRIDVKSYKDSHALGYTWVELQNVAGKLGWIYSEYMNTVVFELKESYIFIDRLKLLEIINENIEKASTEDGESIIYCSKEGLGYYRIYRRTGRNDRVIKVPFSDFEHLVHKILYK